MFLTKELDDGNTEYKRCLVNIDDKRMEEYITQMIWRVGEGNGEAIYYLGIEDDGSFYSWTVDEKDESLKTIKKIASKANLKIVKAEKIKYTTNEYFKIIIREKEKLLIEKRILLLGPSGVGKSTFLANIILSKIDQENKEARLYLMNHKHELISKKTSSFNYLYLIHKDIKWVFIEAPGDDKYNKTRNKIILSFGSSIDCCLFIEKDSWDKKDYYVKYLEAMKIPYININLYDSTSKYNTRKLIDKDNFFKNILKLCPNIISQNMLENKNTEFVILQSFTNNHLGVVLTGILKTGNLDIYNTFYLHSNNVFPIKINSIHLDGKPLTKISGSRTISICIDALGDSKESYLGIISNKKLEKINNFKIEFNNKNSKGLTIFKDNKIMNYVNYKNYYQTNDKIFLVEDGIGFNN
jgi:GTPase